MKPTQKLAEIAGWYGMAAIVASYALVSFKIIPPSGYSYQFLNLTGAIGIIAISVVRRVKQSVVLNVFWAAIAAAALLHIMLQG